MTVEIAEKRDFSVFLMARAVFDKFYQLSSWGISFWHRKLIQNTTNHLNNPV